MPIVKPAHIAVILAFLDDLNAKRVLHEGTLRNAMQLAIAEHKTAGSVSVATAASVDTALKQYAAFMGVAAPESAAVRRKA